MKCSNCGAELPEEAFFCGECGFRVALEAGEEKREAAEADDEDAAAIDADGGDALARETGHDALNPADADADADAGSQEAETGSDTPPSPESVLVPIKLDDKAGDGAFEGSPFIEVDSAHIEDMPVLHVSKPGSTVTPPTPPFAIDLDRNVIIGLAVIGVAVAVIAIAVIGWVILPALFAAAAS